MTRLHAFKQHSLVLRLISSLGQQRVPTTCENDFFKNEVWFVMISYLGREKLPPTCGTNAAPAWSAKMARRHKEFRLSSISRSVRGNMGRMKLVPSQSSFVPPPRSQLTVLLSILANTNGLWLLELKKWSVARNGCGVAK